MLTLITQPINKVLTLFITSHDFDFIPLSRQAKYFIMDIKGVIKRHGFDVKDVAAIMGITPTGLSQHINGNPTVDTLQRIATAIGCNVSEFFGAAGTRDALQCPHCGKPITVRIE